MVTRVLPLYDSVGGVVLCCCGCWVLSLYQSRTGVNVDCSPPLLGCFCFPSVWELWVCALWVVVCCWAIIVRGGSVVECVAVVEVVVGCVFDVCLWWRVL